VARDKRKAFAAENYWGRPVPGFGDPQARLLIVGLAPGAHGSNRTGRMFTGDGSGDFLTPALFRAGFANQPTSRHAGDGLALRDAFVVAVAHCAPPDNRPTQREIDSCRGYLLAHARLLPDVRVVLCLGQIAFHGWLAGLRASGAELPRPLPRFHHAAKYELGGKTVVCTYHPSRQNTQTGRLTPAMFDSIFRGVRRLLDAPTSA
jgi:uracil-DNA glycosylase family 4